MKLTIVSVNITDFGTYKCVAKNSLGETDGSIKLYRKYFYNLNNSSFRPKAFFFSLGICRNFGNVAGSW